MVKVKSSLTYIGSGWSRQLFYVEEYICPTCKFRVKQPFEIVEWGEAFGQKFTPDLVSAVVSKNDSS